MKHSVKYSLGLLLGVAAGAGIVLNGPPAQDFPAVPSFAEARAESADKPVPPVAIASEPLERPERLSVRVGDLESPFSIVSLSALPGERVPVSISAERGASPPALTASATAGSLLETGKNRWEWTAPAEAGVSTLSLEATGGDSPIMVNFLVMTPYSQLNRRTLNGYAIGEYPAKALNNNPVYSRPRGFVEVTPENESLLVSPHFRLKQFLCKQEASYPKYLVLNERLILKLEHILAEVNSRGHRAGTFHVMSGYRTPAYNQGLGNVKYSLHQFGYAADIFIDEAPQDGNMDDLNRDGRSNEMDAVVLSRIIEEMDRSKEYRQFAGGLGSYEETQAHGPFVHVDVRGWGARW